MIILLSLAGVVHAAGDATSGQTKAMACAGCHGMDGNSPVETFPKLAGQGEKYIASQIAAFKANTTRQDPIMLGMVAALTDQDAADIGAFYATQKLASDAPHDKAKANKGRQIYKGGIMKYGIPACQGCHGPEGAGNAGAGYPQVGGQFTAYTIKQLNAFKDGTRSNDDKSVMRMLVENMKAEQIEAVAHYIASMK